MTKLKLKNPYRELRFFQRRLLIVVLFIIFLVICLISRLVFLQFIEEGLYTTLSKQNQLNLIPIDPNRGLIYDRNGVLLAENIPVFSLDIIPSKVKHLKQTISQLRQLIKIDQDEVQAFYRELSEKRPFDQITLKVKLTPEQVAKFSVNRWRFPGVTVNAHLIRYYPHGKFFAQVVGYMGRINQQELAHVNATNYSATNYIGKAGIEEYFESLLHGTVGYQQVETDASGRIIRVVRQTPPIPGDNLYLTIDSGLEKVAEQAMQHQNGAVVAIDPNTGEILALVSKPSFNPNLFVRGISEKKYEKLQNAPNQPLYNRALRGLYAPGSTIKPYYGLLGLSSEVITPDDRIYDPGYLNYAGHTYHSWKHTGFGWVNLENSIIVSDDIYFYDLAIKLGLQRMADFLSQFGFGQPTQIEMNDELPGLIPSVTWKQKHFGTVWYTGDTINMGIGQGYLLVTPLQMAQAVAMLAERGTHLKPHLLLKMQTPNGIIIPQKPIQLPSVAIPENNWDLIVKAMTEVVSSTQGTAYRFGKTPYTVAAKTGTAQVYTIPKGSKYTLDNLPEKYRDNSLFIAFAPVKNPQIALAIVVEHADIAPLVARQIMDYYLLQEHHFTIPSTTPQNTDETTNQSYKASLE